MIDYWSKLKLNECWSDRERYNIVMKYIESELETIPAPEEDTVETCNLTVQVKDDNDDNVSSVNIKVYDDSESYEATTDDSGECGINDVPYGTYTIEAVADGYASTVETIIIDQSELSVDLILNLEDEKDTE